MESPAYRYLAAVLDTLVAEGLGAGSEVVIIHVETGFGREAAEGAAVAARRLGLLAAVGPFSASPGERRAGAAPGGRCAVYRPVPSTMTSPSRSGPANAVGAQLGWSLPESRSSGMPSVIALRGFTDRASGSTTGQMIPSDGPNSGWFSHCYRDANGTEPPYPAAAAFAAGVVWQRCVREAGTVESLPVRAASQRLDTTTLFGRFRVDPVAGVQTGHQIRVVQWRGGQRVLVDRPLRRT